MGLFFVVFVIFLIAISAHANSIGKSDTCLTY